MFYLVNTPWLLKKLYPKCTWQVETTEKVVYLTFDDGPQPVVTEFVLDTLKQYNAKATFFCIGKNVQQNKSLYERIISEGHQVGNHTYSHLNGWKTKDSEYLDDIYEAGKLIRSNLFRPPYGRASRFQLEQLSHKRFNLKPVMWSVLSGDFDNDLQPKDCYLNVTRNSGRGSIIVFHDSAKAYGKLKEILPEILLFFKEKGYGFRKINL